jgi:hypothetical protein
VRLYRGEQRVGFLGRQPSQPVLPAQPTHTYGTFPVQTFGRARANLGRAAGRDLFQPDLPTARGGALAHLQTRKTRERESCEHERVCTAVSNASASSDVSPPSLSSRHSPRTHLLTHSFTHSLTHLLNDSLARSLTCSLTCSLIHSLADSLTRSLTCSLTCSLAHSLADSLTRSLTHLLTCSLTHSLTHSLTRKRMRDRGG